MDHSFENLGPDRFQQLVQALLISTNPRTVCFPIGQPDGGRDAVLPAGFELGKDEFIVFQVKYSRQPAAIENVSEWLLDKAAGELEKIERLKARGAKQYFLVTNVSGTAHLDVGSIDKTIRALKESIGISIHCWFRDDLNRLLDGHWDIKLRYPEVLSGHDFFRILLEAAPRNEQERRLNALRAFLADQYEEDVQVKFKQVELQNRLLDLFIDLPFRVTFRTKDKAIFADHRSAHDTVRVFYDDNATILTNQNDDDNTSGTASLLLGDWGQRGLRQVVVEGAPGQGKSTLAQYLCQVHRIRILNKQTDFEKLSASDQQAALKIPLKVDLRDLAAWLEGNDPFETLSPDRTSSEPRTMESFLARLVRLHSGGIQFDVNDVLEVSKLAPLLIVLDGLDEVVEIKQRSDIITAITRALPRIRENCPQVGVVITSRPAAFANSPGFDSSTFPHIELLSVKRSQISEYAERWMEARGLTKKERDEFRSILAEKMSAPHLRDLSRNPMQLTILLSLILTQGAALPDKRTNLYDDYVDLFFSRESSKSPTVRKHIVLLKDLHRFLGWTLHANAETNRRKSSGRISTEELRSTLNSYLLAEGHPTEVVEEIFGAMLERVVMIVPRIQGTYEFEVQPLREYFAARFLYDTASYSPTGKEKRGSKPDRFDAIARNFYWLNVVRFFAGCFSKGELLDLADRVKALIEEPLIGKTRHPVELTAMLLADWVFEQSPKAVSQLVEVLSTPTNMQRLLPVRHGMTEVISLPPQSGGRKVFDSAFAMIEAEDTPLDRRRNLAVVAAAQSSPATCDQRWLESATYGTNPTQWLQIGWQLGALSRIDDETLSNKLSKITLTRSLAIILIQAGRSESALSSQQNVQLLHNVLLTVRSYTSRPKPLQAPFYLLSFVLSHSPYHLHYLPNSVRESFATFKDKEPSETDAGYQSKFPFVRQCYELSLELSRGYSEAATATQQLGVFDITLEKCRNLWGLRPAIAAAQIECAAQRRIKASALPFDFFAEGLTTAQRLKGAKARRNNSDWWLNSLGRSARAPKSLRLLLIEALVLLCPVGTILSCEASLSEILESMPGEEWTTLVQTASASAISLRAMNSEEQTAQKDVKLESMRFSFLIAWREPRSFAPSAFLRFFRSYSGDVQEYLEFKQVHALNCAATGFLEWSEALAIVRDCYTRRVHAPGIEYQLQSVLMPVDVYSEILSNSQMYPVDLCDAAEAIASRAARKAVKPVAAVAKTERWFAFDR